MYVLGKRELSGSEATKEGGVQPGGLQVYQSLGSTSGRRRGTERSTVAATFLWENVEFTLFIQTEQRYSAYLIIFRSDHL